MLASVATFSIHGLESREVTVEVDIRPRGLPAFSIVGLPDRAVRESRERVKAAIKNSSLDFPDGRITANLAPADLRKAGPAFDLALAVGLLTASGQIPAATIAESAICGELSLGGALRPVRGLLSIALGARRCGYQKLIVPAEHAGEAALVEGLNVIAVPDLEHLGAYLRSEWEPPVVHPGAPVDPEADGLDLADVRGQADAKRALEIAAAGGHNVLFIGPPGAGKTMLARRLPGLLPPPTFEEAVELTLVKSVAGLGKGRLVTERPFRAPHHTISPSGMVGGGAVPRPGEITLAHKGVLFLDELPEFPRPSLEALRQPMEERRVWVMRAQRSTVFPADFHLVAAANECPCGRGANDCRCTEFDKQRYSRRLSGPLIDRIDIVCRVGAADPVELVGTSAGETSDAVRQRVLAARERQGRRLGESATNGSMDGRATRRLVAIDDTVRSLLLHGHRRLGLTARGHDRVLRIARTIADLGGSDSVKEEHVAEALGFRPVNLAVAA